jgi:type IV secretion system protein TrbL
MWLLVPVFALMLLVVGAAVAGAQQPGVLDAATLSYKRASFTWMDRLHPFAMRIFALVSGIGFALAGLRWILSKDELDDVAIQFVRRFAFISFWFTIMFSWEMWIPAFLDVFTAAGISASGRATLNPSEIVGIGTDLQSAIGISAVDFFVNPLAGATIQFAGLLVLLAYVIAAVAVSYTLIQSYLVMGAGVLFLGFAGWESTAQLTDNYLNLLTYIGIKVMVLFLLVGLGTEVAGEMVRATAAMRWSDMSPAGEILFSSFLFASLVLGLPVMFASRITQGQHFGLVSAVRAKAS